MKRIWPYLYITLFIASVLGGTELFGKHDENTNADWGFVTVSFVVCFIFPSMAISYARHRTGDRIPRAFF